MAVSGESVLLHMLALVLLPKPPRSRSCSECLFSSRRWIEHRFDSCFLHVSSSVIVNINKHLGVLSRATKLFLKRILIMHNWDFFFCFNWESISEPWILWKVSESKFNTRRGYSFSLLCKRTRWETACSGNKSTSRVSTLYSFFCSSSFPISNCNLVTLRLFYYYLKEISLIKIWTLVTMERKQCEWKVTSSSLVTTNWTIQTESNL